MLEVRTRQLCSGDRELASRLFTLMAEVFEEEREPLSTEYLDRLLNRADLWILAAFVGAEIVGGVTAHTLPMTRSESSELFIYDIAIQKDHQRRGVGRKLMHALRDAAAAAGIREAFVPADNDDGHALDFYRALGGAPSAVTHFSFSADEARASRP